ncbi:hypothetical protein EVAR_93788_1 [Eumeta japonica]|uniref:Uncharacterized protein n=1 Tax=Eumeta variegata TaxID=151549 RepID=A0A4C1VEM6_EUMVA|nr:hypothetical protein EVAR_93788_1 [Eumeta japonica]
MNGRELHRYFPKVSHRLQEDWIDLEYQTSPILTEHGCFRKRLSELRLCEERSIKMPQVYPVTLPRFGPCDRNVGWAIEVERACQTKRRY